MTPSDDKSSNPDSQTNDQNGFGPQPESSNLQEGQGGVAPVESRPAFGPSMDFEQTQTVSAAPAVASSSSKKRWIIGGLMALLVTLLIAAGVFAYLYDKPERVVADAMTNAIAAKTVISDGKIGLVYGEGDEKMSFDISLNSRANGPSVNGQFDASAQMTYKDIDKNDRKLSLSGSGMLSESGKMYFKINEVRKAFDELMTQEDLRPYFESNPQLKNSLNEFVTKIDGRWINIEEDALNDIFEKFDYNAAKQCYTDAYAKLDSDRTQRQQILDAYSNNAFVVIKNPSTETIDGVWTNKYDVGIDMKKLDAADQALRQTDFYKASSECNKQIFENENISEITDRSDEEIAESQKEIDKAEVSIWVSRIDHQLSRATFRYVDEESKSSVDSTFNFKMNQDVKTSDPEDSMTLSQLQEEIRKVQESLYGDFQLAPSASSANDARIEA